MILRKVIIAQHWWFHNNQADLKLWGEIFCETNGFLIWCDRVMLSKHNPLFFLFCTQAEFLFVICIDTIDYMFIIQHIKIGGHIDVLNKMCENDCVK